MIDLDGKWKLGWDEHMQPGDHVGDLEDDKREASTEEAFEKVTHHVIG